ncbi:sedoheptulokinase-like isoform X2 [Planococcus citri]|uniref:sedoheptulokinase-like isoform X2 n=1 Tax=Planococcus citri TaxID=170843 RepID=UPI0031F91905
MNYSKMEIDTLQKEGDGKGKNSKYLLGIDMGTTSVKVTVIEEKTRKIVAECSKPTESYEVQNEIKSEQDVVRIVEALDHCMDKIPKKILKQIIGIGICGQQHGLVCWSSENKPWKPKKQTLKIDKHKVSPHYTWQDGRCSPTFLRSLPKEDSHLSIHTGYACCTLFWLQRNSPETLQNFNCAGTIADFTVSMLCDLDKPSMTPQNASSWGYFNTYDNTWNVKILQNASFPVSLLPTIVQTNTIAGYLKSSWHLIPAGTPVGAALGDLQSTVSAVLHDSSHAMINLSTSAQLVFIENDFNPNEAQDDHSAAVKIVPYFDNKYLYEAASLNGGNALNLLVTNAHQCLKQYGSSIKKDTLWTKLIAAACEKNAETDLQTIPAFLGERFDPNLRANITKITPSNFNLASIFRSFCKGIIASFHDILPESSLKRRGICKIIGTGSALLRNKALQMELESQYHLPVEYKNTGDAALGAALSILNTLQPKLLSQTDELVTENNLL